MNEFDQIDEQNKKVTQKKKKSVTKSVTPKKITPEEKREQIKELFEKTDSLTPQQLKQKNKEKELQKHELQGGGSISFKDVKDILAANRQPYRTHFGYEKPFYLNIYKLNGWPEAEHRRFIKRREVPSWTMRLIYARFGKDAINHMRKNNPLLFAYIRRDKYFQYLNEDGQKQLDGFIDDFTRMMIGYNDWDKFEADYCSKYKLDRPGKLF